MNKTFKIIIAIIAILLIGAGIYLAKDKKTETIWSTYSNSTYGFSFQYPADWNVDATNISDPENPTIFIQSPQRVKALKDNPDAPIYLAEIIVKIHPSNYKPIMESAPGRVTLNGIPADIYTYQGDGAELTSFFIEQDKYTYEIVEEKPVRIVYTEILSTFSFTSPASSIETKTRNVTILVPNDMAAYGIAMQGYINEGKPNPAPSWPFVKKTVSVTTISGSTLIQASAQAAAEQISTQAGKYGAQIAYLKIVNGTAYILTAIDFDGWAGSSYSLAMIKPLIEKTLLQFPEITSVKFSVAPGDASKPNLQIIPFNDVQTSDLKTYSDSSLSFEYPSLLSVKKEGEVIKLAHSVAYKHPNPCDFKGDAPPLERLSDFDVSILVVDKSVKDYIQSGGWPNREYVLENPYKLGDFQGYRITPGIEGCGQDLYYFVISPNKTLVITRPLIAEFNSINAEYQKYLSLPGIITPTQAEDIFTKILSTLKFTSAGN